MTARPGGRRFPRRLVPALSLAALVVLGGVSFGTPARKSILAFGPPQVLGPGFAPDVAVNGRGDSVVVWDAPSGVVAATRSPGGRWSAPATLRANDPEASEALPRVAINARGYAVALWGSARALNAATRSPDGRWSAPSTVSRGWTSDDLAVAINRRGDAVAVWPAFRHRHGVVQAAVRRAHGRWSAVQTISRRNGYADAPRVVLADTGEAIAVWHAGVRGTSGAVQASTRRPGGPWSRPQRISPIGAVPGEQQLAMSHAGDAIAIWSYGHDFDTAVQIATLGAEGGAWSPPRTLSRPAETPQVGVAPNGRAVAVWGRIRHGGRRLDSAQAAAGRTGGAWGPARTLFEGAGGGRPAVAVLDDGEAVVLWGGVAAIRSPNGAWSAPLWLYRHLGGLSDIAAGGNGVAVAAWTHGSQSPSSTVPQQVWAAVTR